MNLDSFQLASLVVHDVPQPNPDSEGLILTDAEIPLDGQIRGYFERKIKQSLRNRGLEVIADANASSVVKDGVSALLIDPQQLVAVSQDLARHLDESQTRRNPAGLLAVALGKVDEGEVVSILKLEREQGLRLRIHMEGEHAEVDLEFLRDLTLTDKTKIFKTSLLRLEDAGQPATMAGLASDDQRGREDGAGVADFFLFTFLGCQLRTNPEKATRDFVRAAEQFINEDVSSDEQRANYQVALLATLQSQAHDLHPQHFANEHLVTADRPQFLARVEEHGLNPSQAFAMDTSLAKASGFKMVFEHGMTLVGSREDLVERVEVNGPAGINGVQLKDVLKRIGGR
ncbi:MAG TPA: nucleoid-associated protein [Gaiellaceae bacterium]|nr:nucleoid-associated protein [Gaiellaceae bacterium]